MRLIIEGVVGTGTGWDWTKVGTISTVEPAGTAATDYKLNTEQGRDDMWIELKTHMLEIFKPKSSLPTAIACKQKTGESVLEFWKRFNDVWTQEAGLGIQPDMDPLLIQTFLSNLKPHLVVPVKQMITEWSTLPRTDFGKALSQKDAAGCFDIPKPSPVSTQHFQGNMKGNFRGRGRGRFRGRNGRGMSRPRNNGCFNCGAEDHWVSQCPHPTSPQTPDSSSAPNQTQQPQASTQQGPTFPIKWGNQQQ